MADRGYGSFGFFSNVLAQGADFIVRLKEKTYQKYHPLFSDSKKKEAIADIFRYIEGYYNTVRLHSTLGYESPAQFEKKAA